MRDTLMERVIVTETRTVTLTTTLNLQDQREIVCCVNVYVTGLLWSKRVTVANTFTTRIQIANVTVNCRVYEVERTAVFGRMTTLNVLLIMRNAEYIGCNVLILKK